MDKPRHEYLSSAESESLGNDALRQQSKAIDSFLTLAALTGLGEARLKIGIDAIRQLDKETARKYGKRLLASVKVLEQLQIDRESDDLATVDELNAHGPDEPQTPERDDDTVDEQTEQAEAGTDHSVVAPIDTDESNERHDIALAEATTKETINDTSALELHPKGLKLVRDVLGANYDVNGKSVDEIAADMYRLAGSPVNYINYDRNRPVDAIGRIKRRLMGLTNAEAAGVEGVTVSSFQVWLSTRIMQPLRSVKLPDKVETESVSAKAAPRVQSIESCDERNTADRLIDIFGDLNDEQRHAVQSFTAHQQPSELADNISELYVSLASLLMERLPQNFDDLQLHGREKAVIRQLLGRYQQDGRPYIKPPIPVYAIIASKMPDAETHVISGVSKLMTFLETNNNAASPVQMEDSDVPHQFSSTEPSDERDSSETHTVEEEFYETLQSYFDADQLDTLWKHIRFSNSGEHLKQTDKIAPVLDKLQKRYVEVNRPSSSRGLTKEQQQLMRQLVVNLSGIRTIEDIYQKLAGNTDSVTSRDGLEQILTSTIIEMYSDE